MAADLSSRLRRLVKGRSDLDLAVLLGLLLIVACLWAFLLIAGLMSTGSLHQLDERMILALRNPSDLADPLGPPWLEEAVRDVTGLGGYAVLTLLTTASTVFLLLNGRWHAACFLVAATVGGMLVSDLLKVGFDRPRPAVAPHLSSVGNASFPSGHSMLSAVVYLTLGSLLEALLERPLLRAYVLGVALLVSFLVGVSRVYLGVHYPTDVLAGWAVGLAWAATCWLLARWLQKRGVIEPPAPGA